MKRTQLIGLALVETLMLGCGAPAVAVEEPIATCAEGPEDVDGFQDDDGCADLDDDGDGIADASDACPCAAEDLDGFEDEDGCPDADNDNDCIQDACDACPMEAERYNGTEDEDGCPDRGHVLLIEERVRILDRIYFDARGTQPSARWVPVLEAVAATIAGNPQLLEVGVIGRSTRQEGERVARARAQAAIDVIVARGVDPSRLTLRTEVEGQGEEARQVWFEVMREAEPAAPSAPAQSPSCAHLAACEAMSAVVACERPAPSQ